MKLTQRQQLVLEQLSTIARFNAFSQQGRSAHLYQSDCEKLTKGDRFCVFAMGALTGQVGDRLGLKAGAVLSVFKALEAKGLIIREDRNRWYQRPLYWWPVGFADILCAEIVGSPL